MKKKISIFQSIPSFCFNPRPALWFFQSPFNHPLLASPKTRGKKDKTKIILVYLCYYTLKSDVTKKSGQELSHQSPAKKKNNTFFRWRYIVGNWFRHLFLHNLNGFCTRWWRWHLLWQDNEKDLPSRQLSHPALVRGSVSFQEGKIHCWLDSLCWFTQILAMMKSCQKN